MELSDFFDRKSALEKQYDNIEWLADSGLSKDELLPLAEKMYDEYKVESVALARSKVFEYLLKNGRISVAEDDIFFEKVDARRIFAHLTWKEAEAFQKSFLPEAYAEKTVGEMYGGYEAYQDFGHVSPNTKRLFELGFAGILERARSERDKKQTLSQKQRIFYDSCEICLCAITAYIKRLAKAVQQKNKDAALCLENISENPPRNTYEALQLLIVYFYAHDYIFGARLRTLGRMDVLLYPYYKNDIENGIFTQEQIKELYRYFLTKLWSMKVPYDLPMMIGGLDSEGNEVTNELSYLIASTYDELDIHSPKIHVRVSQKTPESFVKLILSCIRGGNSSFVFANDKTVVSSLVKCGIDEKEALDYVFIGCYEAAVWGVEMPCTGNGSVNLAKALELAMNDGCDMKNGQRLGVPCPDIRSFDDFCLAVKAQIRHLSKKACDYVTLIETHYERLFADPILSSMYDKSVCDGMDLYEKNSAKYNNSSINVTGIGTLTDSLCAVKKIVFDQKRVSFEKLCQIMKNNWQGEEKLKLVCSNLREKYGNCNELADSVARDMAKCVADSINGVKNGRGGIFKAGLFSIDKCYPYGEKTAATPDGRGEGEPVSKNLCATVGKDKNGITSLVRSVGSIDLSDFSNGSVLDFVLCPSAVSGDDGLCAMYSVLKTFFDCGGFAMHGNVFDSGILKKAQDHPEEYATLQVRVCGWNAYFVNLSKAEQDDFIKQAENH